MWDFARPFTAGLNPRWWSSKGRLSRPHPLDRILPRRPIIRTYHMDHTDIGVAVGTADTIGGEATTVGDTVDTVGARSYGTSSALSEPAGFGATGLALRAVSTSEKS
jgi:hypothetical protein